jgi:endonuclease III
MKKILTFIDVWGIRIITPLILIVFLKTCSTNSKIIHSEKKLTQKVDSLTAIVNTMKTDLREEIKIEGLRSEKRMIQSTDRKILDVTRQSEIDKELSSLEK